MPMILNACAWRKGLKSKVLWFSRKNEVKAGAFVRENKIYYRGANGEREIMPVAEMQLKGSHNVENVLAAVCIGIAAGCTPEQIRSAVKAFKAVEHRLEYVATVGGVQYYNDSKATNVDATIKALESFPANIHIILGGKDKGSDYTVLKPLLRERVKRVYTIGAAAEKIESHIAGRDRDRARGNAGECGSTGDRVGATGRCRAVGSGVRELRSVHGIRAARKSV